ncbi:MAG: S9 family peptidase [Acidobacteriota bacterium]|nr:MAG: S9 family peptidase [Acidobacteriota bacterium]
MKNVRALYLLLVFVSLPLTAFAAEPRPMTIDDWLNIVRIDDVMISPDGKQVFFAKTEYDWTIKDSELSKGGYKDKKTFYMVSAQGGDPVQFIGEAGGSSFQFSPSGEFLSLRRRVDGKSQVFLMPTSGGEAIQLTKHKEGVSAYRWSDDSSKLFFLADQALPEEEEKLRKAGYDAIFVDEAPNGQEEGKWNHLWSFDRLSKQEKQLTSEPLIIRRFDPSPDGQKIVLAARSENRRNQQYLSELYLLDVASGTRSRLTENEAPESSPRWSPNGSTIAYLAPDDKTWELRQDKIWLIDPDTRMIRLLTPKFEGEIRTFFWASDSQSILFSGQQKTNTNLYRVNLADGAVTQLTSHEGRLQIEDLSTDRSQMVYTVSSFDKPADLYSSAVFDASPVQLTSFNPWFEKEIQKAKMRVIQWKSKDGLEIEGLLHLPPDYREGEAVPLMLNIHGGPAGSFDNSFVARYHVYAGLGYASLSPNVRGSSGYTDALLRGNMNDLGGGDYEDLMSGVDSLIAQGIADPDRLALRGWSYGGILGGWTITQTSRFKAASVGAMVSDWTSEYGPGFNHDVRLWYIGGTPWENPEEYRRMSALTHVGNVTTPTIIFHGLKDTTDTEPQSMMFFTALKDLGREVRYLKFPREPHGFDEPRHVRTLVIEEIRWMEKHVRGNDWQPPERPEEDDDKKEGSAQDQ